MPASSLNFLVDDSLCTRCDLCITDCPARIIRRDGAECPSISPEDEGGCIACQHCLTICPEAAVSIRGLVPQKSPSLVASELPSLNQMELLVRGRRSVRQYRPENVEPALVHRLLDALSAAPTGVNCRQLTFSVIQDRAVLARLRERVLEGLRSAQKSGQLSPKQNTLASSTLSSWDQGRDLVFRGAPHLLLVSAPPTSYCPQQDVVLTLAYFELLAQSAGLGTVWCGYAYLVLEALPELKPLFGLGPEHVYYPMLFGLPAVKYARVVQRSGSATIRRVEDV
jgi:nitroreductase/NAD-dependent dihydropyrimidine dehydrogenase PreA subunit